MRYNLFKLSGISFLISAIIFGIDYYCFHYVTDAGFTLEFHEEAAKPFLTDLIGQLGVLFLFLSMGALLVAWTCFPKKKKKKNRNKK